MPSLLPQNKHFADTSKKLLKNRNKNFPVVRYFTGKLELFSDIFPMVVDIDDIIIHDRQKIIFRNMLKLYTIRLLLVY